MLVPKLCVFMHYKILNKGYTIPINGISGYRHIICRLAQVKEKLQLVSHDQLFSLQLLAEELKKIFCKTRWKHEILCIVATHDKKLQLRASDNNYFTFGSTEKVRHGQLPLLEVL